MNIPELHDIHKPVADYSVAYTVEPPAPLTPSQRRRLRIRFASAVVSGVANRKAYQTPEEIADLSVAIADALIARLETNPPSPYTL